MKKIVFSLLMVSFIFLLASCSKNVESSDKDFRVDVGRTEENSQIVDYVLNNVLDTYSNKDNTFLLFSENGYFIRYYSTKIHFKSGNVLMIRGTWKFDGNNLTLNVLDRVEMVPNDDATDYVLKYEENNYQDHFNNLEMVQVGEKSYLSGSQSLRKKNDIIHDKLLNEIKKYVSDGITDVDYELLKTLDQENTNLNS